MMLVGPMKKKLVTSMIVLAVVMTAIFMAVIFVITNVKDDKIEELVKRAEVVERYVSLTKKGDDYWGLCYLKGVCVVDLLDFNCDGVDDLLLVCHKGTNSGLNIDDKEMSKKELFTVFQSRE